MTKKQIMDEITGDKLFMRKWRDLCKSGDLDKILELCECYRSQYSKGARPSEIPHIQSENNGGMKAWDKLSYLITSLAFDESNDSSQSENYIGYVRDARSTRKANSV